MKIYIAAPWELRPDAQALMVVLEELGHTVTSTWLKQDDGLPGVTPDLEANDNFARMDLADVEAADLLLAYNPRQFERSGTGGRHVEFGYAVALNLTGIKPIRLAIIGIRSNIFHYINRVKVYASIEAFLESL